MPLVYRDRVKETTTTTGTGTLTLAGAVAGFRTFASAVADGSKVTYCIENGTDWEVGQGVFTASGTTLTRNVIASSNGNALVSWAAGSKNVFLTQAARDVRSTRTAVFLHGNFD